MSVPRVSVIPVGRVDSGEIEQAAARVAKVLRAPVAIREPLPIPRGTEDPSRGQHDAARLLAALRSELLKIKTVKTVGADASPAPPSPAVANPAGSPANAPKPPPAEVAVFVTDVDLFTPATDGVWTHLDVPHRAALVSVRRQREAFYRRKADPAIQRARLVKEILRVAARLSGLPDCNDSKCALSVSLATGEQDRKQEHYCAACWKRLSLGTMRL